MDVGEGAQQRSAIKIIIVGFVKRKKGMEELRIQEDGRKWVLSWASRRSLIFLYTPPRVPLEGN